MTALLRQIAARVLLAATLLVAFAAGALAQDGPDFAAWDAVATRAEEAIESREVSEDVFESLRQELTDWRQVFQEARTRNEAAIDAVQAQIEALGPKPEEGEEPAETAEQREILNTRLNELRAPVQRAEVAFSRADALIAQIDRILRERQADRLLRIGPTPLNPVIWPRAVEALVEFFRHTAQDISANWNNPARIADFRQNLPKTVLLLTLALILTLRGRDWVERLVARLQDQGRTAERWLTGFVISLGQILLPVLGLLLLAVAGISTEMLGDRGDLLMATLPAAGFQFFAARWLGGRLFPRTETHEPLLSLDSAQRTEGRFHASILGLVLFLALPIRRIQDFVGWSPEIFNVLTFPLLVVAGLALLRLGQLLLRRAPPETEGSSEPEFRQRLVSLLSRITMGIAVLGPVLAAIGYFNAGEALVYPTISSLMLLSLIVVLQRLVDEVYILFSRNREGVREALTPVLAGFALAIVSIPLFALIWGARVTDLTELWNRFLAGFTVGETRISPTDFLTFVVVFIIGYAATRLLQSALRSSVLPKTQLDMGGQNAVASGIGYVGIFAAALIAITSAGLDLSALAYVAGALSVGIGFGLQNIVSNFVSGIILLIERPVATGDWIEVGGQMGFVRDISVRSTRIETFDRTDVIVPNADLISGTVTNWTRGNLVGRLIVPVGVAYGTDTRRVEKILQEVAEAQPMVLLNPPPYVYFKGFGADSLDFEVRAILRDINAILVVQTEMNHQITERFRDEGIEIPFAQRDIWLRNPETLRSAPPGPLAPAGPGAGDPQDPAAGAAQLHPDDLPGHDGEGEGDR
ncbi:Small Conductance Mechanosensitive Ion Channel [Pseudooceanicola batsensis HTCC2597]|uniref:Small Conductance Mechanosensitive Ion Channel n=1 Tax=Pseudooceanicola batsensis (strain ATCC BAA-863 / DSM 15984 / KCTC 12145 / HTCC2597) TaxID=252305 RepID=A3U2K2_PSEBH|nr:DUF3772 domain-containing protein [Pseudooceanicola batsensis]EAQ01576.1 Small Conductance Mechanosensitive Ion Channel [Pseudooceanicola batsensis HTCC2597]